MYAIMQPAKRHIARYVGKQALVCISTYKHNKIMRSDSTTEKQHHDDLTNYACVGPLGGLFL